MNKRNIDHYRYNNPIFIIFFNVLLKVPVVRHVRRKARVRATGPTLKQNKKSISWGISSQQISGKNTESK